MLDLVKSIAKRCTLHKERNKESEVAQSCPTLCDLMDYSLSGSSVHGIFQAGVLEWIAISFSRGSSWARNRTRVSRIAGRHFTIWATREAPYIGNRWFQLTRQGSRDKAVLQRVHKMKL